MRHMPAAELRLAIAHLGMTQEGLAYTIGVGPRTMRQWLTNGVNNTPAAILIRILVAKRNWNDLITIGYGKEG